MIERAVPILPGDDLSVAKEFYVGKLGFTVVWEATEDGKNGIMGLKRGTIEITIDCPMSGHGRNACASLRVNDADAYYEEWRQKVEMKRAPQDEEWGARTFGVTDPFGNTIFVIGPIPKASSATSVVRTKFVVRDSLGTNMQDAATTCLHLLTYAEPLLRDLSDEHLPLASDGNGKTAGWLLGHLCVTGDFVRRKCGRPALTPKEWGPRFAPGTQPSRQSGDYPPVEALRAAFDGIYRDLAAFTPSLSAESLAMPSPYEPVRARFATLGEFTTWIMTGHLGYHLGQLYGWRSAVDVAESRQIVG